MSSWLQLGVILQDEKLSSNKHSFSRPDGPRRRGPSSLRTGIFLTFTDVSPAESLGLPTGMMKRKPGRRLSACGRKPEEWSGDLGAGSGFPGRSPWNMWLVKSPVPGVLCVFDKIHSFFIQTHT